MTRDPFAEYIKQSNPDKRELSYAWYTAIGLQAVDGLQTTEYLRKTAIDNIEGIISISEANRIIESYYEERTGDDDSKEADIVSARIARVLSEGAFTFSVPQYINIHKRLFDGIFSHAGRIRNYNISKKEWVLDGETVLYGNAPEIPDLLEYDIQREKNYKYSFDSMSDIISHLAKFVSMLWQIHAFGEGNTRTTAVFFIKYLNSMGFSVTNDIFAENSWYFRNALVRANYNNFAKGIRETTEYLELFLRNLLLGERNELKNRYLHIRWDDTEQDIETEKQDIQPQKQDIGAEKQDIEIPDGISRKTADNIRTLYSTFGKDKFFGRSDVMQALGITASPASLLIKRMLEADLIIPLVGKGKGKYLFK